MSAGGEGAGRDLRGLARAVDALDYYDVLEVEPGASARAIQLAFHRAARRAHPDARRHQPPELRAAAERVARRVAEAYAVLRDPESRHVYDERRRAGGLRIQLAEARSAARASKSPERAARTPQGRRFFLQARSDLERGELDAAVRGLRMALAYEPGNARFREQLDDALSRRD